MAIGNKSLDHVVKCSSIQCPDCLKTLREMAARLNERDVMARALRSARFYLNRQSPTGKTVKHVMREIDAVLGKEQK